MLKVTQDILEKIALSLDAGDAESAGRLLVDVDQTMLRAVLLHIMRKWGGVVADAVGVAYLREQEAPGKSWERSPANATRTCPSHSHPVADIPL